MAKVTIYTAILCPYCHMAKLLLARKGVRYAEIDIGNSSDRRDEMIEKSGGRRTVPQIFISDTHVGGCDDLHALDRTGKLDLLLAG